MKMKQLTQHGPEPSTRLRIFGSLSKDGAKHDQVGHFQSVLIGRHGVTTRKVQGLNIVVATRVQGFTTVKIRIFIGAICGARSVVIGAQ